MRPLDDDEVASLRATQAVTLWVFALAMLAMGGGLLLVGDGRAAIIMASVGAVSAVVAVWPYRLWRRYREADRTWFEGRFER